MAKLVVGLLQCCCTVSFLLAWLRAGQCAEAGAGATELALLLPYGPRSPFPERRSISWEDALLEMAAADDARLLYLTQQQAVPVRGKRTFVPVASGRQLLQSTNYIVRAGVGTPPQTMLMAMDISSDAAFLPCLRCNGCPPSAFANAKSTSYKTLPCGALQCQQVPNPSCFGSTCSFNQTYGTSTFSANVSQDTLTLAADAVPSYTFGCLWAATGSSIPPQGLLGLGRGPLSLLSQTQNRYRSTFSYCLPSLRSPNFSGTLRLGPSGQPLRIKTTPLLRNPTRPSLYYVNMIGISVGRRRVDIPPRALAFDPATGGGTIIDSGTGVTRLVEPAYVAVRDEFRRRVKGKNATSLGGFDTCYDGPIAFPTMTLHFTGMNVTLPVDNLVIRSTAGSITCLAMAAAPSNVNSVLNVIANMQQQNHRVLFDVPNARVGFARELCS